MPHPEPPTHLPTHPIPLGCPRAPVLKVLRKLHSSGVASFLNSPALNLWGCPGTFWPRLAGPPARAERRMGAGGSLSPPPRVKQTEQCHPDCCYSPQGKNALSRWRTQKNNERKIQTLIQIEAIYFQSPQTHFALIQGENLGKQSKPHIQKPDLFYCAQRPEWKAAHGTQEGRPRGSHGTKAASRLAGVTRALIPTQLRSRTSSGGSASLGQPQTLGYTLWGSHLRLKTRKRRDRFTGPLKRTGRC